MSSNLAKGIYSSYTCHENCGCYVHKIVHQTIHAVLSLNVNQKLLLGIPMAEYI